jgi:hypothetical protein
MMWRTIFHNQSIHVRNPRFEYLHPKIKHFFVQYLTQIESQRGNLKLEISPCEDVRVRFVRNQSATFMLLPISQQENFPWTWCRAVNNAYYSSGMRTRNNTVNFPHHCSPCSWCTKDDTQLCRHVARVLNLASRDTPECMSHYAILPSLLIHQDIAAIHRSLLHMCKLRRMTEAGMNLSCQIVRGKLQVISQPLLK